MSTSAWMDRPMEKKVKVQKEVLNIYGDLVSKKVMFQIRKRRFNKQYWQLSYNWWQRMSELASQTWGHEFEQTLAAEERGAWPATLCGIAESDTTSWLNNNIHL